MYSMVRVGYWGGRRVGGERRADTHQEGATTDIVGGPLNEPEAGHRQLSHLNLREGKVQYISGCSLSLVSCLLPNMKCEYAGFRLSTAVPGAGSVGAAGTSQGDGGTVVGLIDRVDPTTLTPRQIFDRWVGPVGLTGSHPPRLDLTAIVRLPRPWLPDSTYMCLTGVGTHALGRRGSFPADPM